MRAILKSILARLGFEIVEASHGREALMRLEELGAPDLALADWNMPEMTGLEFVRTVRATPSYSELRLVVPSRSHAIGERPEFEGRMHHGRV